MENAVSLQGGIEYLRNLRIASSGASCVEVTCQELAREGYGFPDSQTYFYTPEVVDLELVYSFCISREAQAGSLHVSKDKAVCTVQKSSGALGLEKGNGKSGSLVTLVRENEQGAVSETTHRHVEFLAQELGRVGELASPKNGELLLGEDLLGESFLHASFRLKDLAVFQFVPLLAKQAVPLTGKANLEEDGRNVALVLKRLLEDVRDESDPEPATPQLYNRMHNRHNRGR